MLVTHSTGNNTVYGQNFGSSRAASTYVHFCLLLLLMVHLFLLPSSPTAWMYFSAGCLTKNSLLKLPYDLSKWH